MSAYDRWLEQPYVDAARQEEALEHAAEEYESRGDNTVQYDFIEWLHEILELNLHWDSVKCKFSVKEGAPITEEQLEVLMEHYRGSDAYATKLEDIVSDWEDERP